ncbi:Ig-like domain-containing protein [Granulosicoccus antarcticus]|uniref:Dystroglycan-type cadherin-like domain-containing protein n=1 Tax=Granulosicoccus antarcticus IMCC3135 TaxID=1192854 RepID=A0A2Z2P2A9_9GAMM|nr:Ig-like domain-containing protein [Granulosicoccus antarcticus]ASJ75450.1 hypothetical protein IMCC3135_26975 [Granulosicoccus antarcticus IMCC3135]
MKKRVALYLSTASSCLLLSACGWVDSTGSQSETVAVTNVYLGDLRIDGPSSLQEQVTHGFTVNRDFSSQTDKTYSWSEEPLEQGKLASCAEIEGFNIELAADSLAEACTDPTQCTLAFEPVDQAGEESSDGNGSEGGEFELPVPQLQASVGLTYKLTVTESAQSSTSDYDFCLIAINEAPVAENDTFVVLEGERTVFAADELNLLSNDSDDVDVSNFPLEILPELEEAPTKAAEFELGDDGSFVYESSLTGIVTDQFDSFEYQLSDGVHVSTATATIRIVAANQAPELIDDIPDLEAIEGVPFVENLSLYFVDPEEADLSFEFSDDSVLPDDGTLALSVDGVLSGIPDEDDVGSHVLTLIVSDGGASVETLITLLIDPAPIEVENTAPEYIAGSVISRTVDLGDAMIPITPAFVDEDGDTLTFAIIGSSDLPDGVEIDEDTGVISGEPEEITNVRNLRIEATDPSGESAVSGLFFIRVR